MTPSQMLAKLSEAKETAKSPTIWIPPERSLSNRNPPTATRDFAEETLSLLQNVCPLCQLKVEVLPDRKDKLIRFQCVSDNPYHFFIRHL